MSEPQTAQEMDAKLLFVDDETSITKTLYRQFMPMGYEVSIANSGAQALEMLEQESFDVVISDMRMPEMNGAALLEQVANRWPETRRILLTGYADLESAIHAVNKGGIHYYLTKPWEEEDVQQAIEASLEAKRLKSQNLELIKEVEEKNNALMELNSSLEQKVAQRTQELQQAFDDLKQSQQATIQICSALVENAQPALRGHTAKVAQLSLAIAQLLKVDDQQCEALKTAAALYSLGKIGMPEEILSAPVTALNKEQLAQFNQYPVIGATTLSALDALEETTDCVQAHRERFDGQGFPKMLSGEAIPLLARILSVSVDFVLGQLGLIVSDKMTGSQAVEYIESHANSKFDPDVVKAFKKAMDSKCLEDTSASEKIVAPGGLQSGMKIARDLHSSNGMLLLPKGHILDQKTIDNLLNMTDLVVYVE